MNARPSIAFFGSSLVSTYWNGAATYYRGILRQLAALGYPVTFFEPDAFGRQEHRDIEDPEWARVVVWKAEGEDDAMRALEQARGFDLVVKASGVGVHDAFLERAVPELARTGTEVLFWDVDAPATLARMQAEPLDPFRALVARYDLVLTYGGGPPVVERYRAFGARECVPVYNALDPDTHHPAEPDPALRSLLSLLANRLPDREERIGEFFFGPASRLSARRFVLGGSGWSREPGVPDNVALLGHVPSARHNAFNASALAVLNVNRASMAEVGWSPATRVFEAAGAGACLVCDRWPGLVDFLEPEREVLVADDGEGVVEALLALTPERARSIGSAARARVLARHTYAQRAAQVDALLCGTRGAA